MGWDCRFGIASHCRQFGYRIPREAGFSALVQTRLRVHQASCTMTTGSLPGGKVARPWHLPPAPSSADIKERVELHLYSAFGLL
jgi:hypothetical protein